MSPINITNLLVRIANYNRMVNTTNNQNINQQNNNLLQNNVPRANTQGTLLPQANIINNQPTILPPQQTFIQPNQNTQNTQNLLPQQNLQNGANVVSQQNNLIAQNLPQQTFIQPNQNTQIAQNLFIQQNFVNQNVNNNGILNNQNPVFNNNNIFSPAKTLSDINSQNFINNLSNQKHITSNLQTRLTSLNERNQNINYVKDLMKLPQEMKDVLSLLQQTQLTQAQQKGQDANRLLLLSNINIKNLTQLIQNGSKEALNHLMSAGLTQNLSKAELKQLEEAVSYLNASASSQDSQTQALKNFMLLYLPWLPLEEGMDFELDFSFKEGSEEDDENVLSIVIMTKHFGEIHILIILKAMNAFEIYVQCCKSFPKNILMKLTGEDEKKYTMTTNMVFEEQEKFEPKTKAQEAKIMLSHVREISPFLLLMANSLIKNTLLLDSQANERLKA